jgi:hypothetical protein
MLKVIGFVLLMFIGVTVIGVGGFYMGVFGNVVTTPGAIINKTVNADNILNNYHWFYDQYNEIKTAKATYDNDSAAVSAFESSAGPRDKWTFEDKTEWNRLTSLVLGARNGYNGLVNDYNSKASQLDKKLFKANDLPDHIDPII